MLCARFICGTKSPQNQNNMSSALWSYKTDKKEHNNMFFLYNKQTKFAILTFWYPKQSARTASYSSKKELVTLVSGLRATRWESANFANLTRQSFSVFYSVS